MKSLSLQISKDLTRQITDISPDIAVCSECLEDMEKDPGWIDYPFVN
jgi:hydrogenase maturation factor HypF (carbamoyltransferase family)